MLSVAFMCTSTVSNTGCEICPSDAASLTSAEGMKSGAPEFLLSINESKSLSICGAVLVLVSQLPSWLLSINGSFVCHWKSPPSDDSWLLWTETLSHCCWLCCVLSVLTRGTLTGDCSIARGSLQDGGGSLRDGGVSLPDADSPFSPTCNVIK